LMLNKLESVDAHLAHRVDARCAGRALDAFHALLFHRTMRLVVISVVLTLCGDVVGDVLRVVPHTPDERGATAREPRQAEEIDAWLLRNAALMFRLALFIERIDLQPGEIDR